MTISTTARRVIPGIRRVIPAPVGVAGVRWVQAALNRVLGTRLAVDGIAGPRTRSAIRAFQQRRGLTVDGIVGPQTRAALGTALAGGAGVPITGGGPACPVPESQEIAWERANPAGRVDIASDGGLSVRILWNFAVGSAALKPEHLLEIRGTGFRGRFGDRVIVEGHSSCSGTPERRQRISELRAATVAEALRKVGIPRAALEAFGESDRRPRVPNTTPEGMARNRRVEIRGGVLV